MFVKVESDQARWKRSQDEFFICLSFTKATWRRAGITIAADM
jgi:hypothetical protein